MSSEACEHLLGTTILARVSVFACAIARDAHKQSDEFRFVVHPIIAGQGKRLMEGISLKEKLQLKLVESNISKSGAVGLRYLKQ